MGAARPPSAGAQPRLGTGTRWAWPSLGPARPCGGRAFRNQLPAATTSILSGDGCQARLRWATGTGSGLGAGERVWGGRGHLGSCRLVRARGVAGGVCRPARTAAGHFQREKSHRSRRPFFRLAVVIATSFSPN